jgi:hypothetical protein
MSSICTLPQCADQFAAIHFAGARLGDRRLSKRATFIAGSMALKPGSSIPRLFDGSRPVKAAYEFFDHSNATPSNIQAGHNELVRRAIAETKGIMLLIEDTSEFVFNGREPIEGLGPVGPGAKDNQGFHLHTVLCVQPPKEGLYCAEKRREPVGIIGLLHQEYYIRTPRPKGEKRSDSYATRKRARETQLWERSTETIGRAPAGVRFIRVGDRGADIYASLRRYVELDHGYVIRAARDRVLEDEEEKLFEKARSLDFFEGSMTIDLRARPGQKARTAKLRLAAAPVNLRSPQLPDHKPGTLPAIDCWIVRITEENPPEGVEKLEWLLLTDEPANSFEKARETALRYASRWIIEDYHKAIKSGLGAEALQLETKERLFAAIALMAVVALRLIDLRERVRLDPEAPASQSGLSSFQLKVLAHKLSRKLTTVRDVALAIGRLGGHMNRKGDGMPGMKTLWLGMITLEALSEGARIALEMMGEER